MDRRTVVKGAAWSLPAVMVAAVAPAVAASAPALSIGEACKLPAQRVSSDYRLFITGLTTNVNVIGVKIKGVAATSWTPSVIGPGNGTLTVSTLPNADSQIDFEIATSDGTVIRQDVKALPCKD